MPGALRIVAIVALTATATLLGQVRPALPTAFKPISFAILEDYDKGDPLSAFEADIALFNELDISTWRGSFGWDDYEPSRERYDFAWLHQFADAAARHRITLRPYIGYTPEWAAAKNRTTPDTWNDPPADPRAWRQFAHEIARALRRHRNVASLEIYNEENVRQWWDGTAEEYARTLVDGSRAIRGVTPRAQVVFGGLVFPDIDWVERVCGVPGVRAAFSVLPVHAYPETWTPPGVTAENYLGGLSSFAETVDRACGRKAIWINETGFATVPGRTERDQASWWVRAVASFIASPRVEQIGIYEIKDLPSDRAAIGDAPNYHLGLTRADRTRKLAFYTVDLLTDLLDTSRIRVADEEARFTASGGGELYYHLFERPDRRRVLVVWNNTSPAVARGAVAGTFKAITEFGLDGRPQPSSITALDELRLTAGEPRVFRLDP